MNQLIKYQLVLRLAYRFSSSIKNPDSLGTKAPISNSSSRSIKMIPRLSQKYFASSLLISNIFISPPNLIFIHIIVRSLCFMVDQIRQQLFRDCFYKDMPFIVVTHCNSPPHSHKSTSDVVPISSNNLLHPRQN